MKEENKLTPMGCIAYLFAVPIAVFLRGWVLQKLWSWFIVKQFNQPEISIPVALGVVTIIGLLTYQNNDNSKKDAMVTITVSILTPLLALFFGWIYTLFM